MARGRPRDVLAPRYPSGRLHHRPPPRQHQPHRAEFGNDPRAATTHGRCLLRKQITPRQHAAGERYLRERQMYLAAIGAPHGLRSAPERHPGEEDPEAVRTLMRRHESARAALGRLVHDVDWVLMLDAGFSDWTDY